MPDTHTWLYNPETKGKWAAPNPLADHYRALGWEDTDPPEEVVVGVLKDAPAEDAPEEVAEVEAEADVKKPSRKPRKSANGE
jgi:hypothetical protein